MAELKRSLRIILQTVAEGFWLPKGYGNFILSSCSALVKSDRNLGMPVHLTIEPTNVCNLRCLVCETGSGILRRPKGSMLLDDFKTVIDKMKCTNTLFFYFMGEPFLNKDAYEMIRYAEDKNIFVSACTNGQNVDAKSLIKSGIGEINFQIGGVTQEMHEKYRVRGNLKRTMDNLVDTLERNEISGNKIKVVVGFIVMKHNAHEVDYFIELAKKLGFEAQLINPCVRTLEQGKELLPRDLKYWIYDHEAFNRGILRPKTVPRNHCEWIYYSTVVLWNGDVVPCCRDAQGEYVMGNVLKQDFEEIWNGEKYRNFRKSIRENQSDMKLCRLCSGYGMPMLK